MPDVAGLLKETSSRWSDPRRPGAIHFVRERRRTAQELEIDVAPVGDLADVVRWAAERLLSFDEAAELQVPIVIVFNARSFHERHASAAPDLVGRSS